MSKMITIALLFLALLVSLSSAPTAAAGRWVDGAAGTLGGTRSYRLWVPPNYDPAVPTPLVMVLHGCTQNPNDIAAGTQFNALADSETFLVVYPEQPSSANFRNCWNWFETANQSRGAGEPAILAAIVADVGAAYTVDANRTFVTGISAGGAMAVVMGATYPDIFRAVGEVAGVEYKAGTDLTSGVLSLTQGGPDPNRQGRLAYEAMGSAARRVPVIVFHGTDDRTVYPINADQVLTQWAQTNDYVDDGSDNDTVDDIADATGRGQVANGRSYTRYSYDDGAGDLLLEKWIVDGMGHAWPGGSTAGSYTDPAGPDATGEMWHFFLESTGSATPLPTATATPPADLPTATAAVPASTPTATPAAANTATLISLGGEDGYAAALVAGGTTGGYALSSDVYVGDNADAPLRGVLSFNTAVLPDDATILSAEVRLFYTQAPIGDPWTGMGALVGDIQAGCLGDSCALVASDFQAPVALAEAVTFDAPASGRVAGALVAGTLGGDARAFINTTGTTQFKLRFQENGNGNGLSDFLLLAGGEYFTSAYRPVLRVTYR